MESVEFEEIFAVDSGTVLVRIGANTSEKVLRPGIRQNSLITTSLIRILWNNTPKCSDPTA